LLKLRHDLKKIFSGPEPEVFDQIMTLQGEAFRDLAGRRTIRVDLAGRSYFAKLHFGVGWREICKNIITLRLPVVGARTEWLAIQTFEKLGVATMSIAGFGERGFNPAGKQSFLLTDELAGTISLEDYCRPWPDSPPSPRLKRAIIEQVARMTRQLHENGVNHRDLYICHFLMKEASAKPDAAPENIELFIIDLHRVQIRNRTPRRWLVKDIAGLYFSSMDIGLTRRDRLRFIRDYRSRPLREQLNRESGFWRTVERKALQLYRKPT
jgi:heptose I phosphotransferase